VEAARKAKSKRRKIVFFLTPFWHKQLSWVSFHKAISVWCLP